jgi:hypothetical protein
MPSDREIRSNGHEPDAPVIRYQAQAVLRRSARHEPLLLVGVTLDSTFFPRTPDDGMAPFVLTKGLVALAPLTAVDATRPEAAAIIAMLDARQTWSGRNSPAASVLRTPG